MILLAFFFPLALYLLVLGGINRRRHPLMMSGVWDFIGLLFAASGFLLLGGPAILSSLNERWRLFWLLGRSSANPEGAWQFWLFLSLLYFLLVVVGAGTLLWRQRALTSIYNTDRSLVEKCLAQICEQLHLTPVRTGNLFLFGLGAESSALARVPAPGAVQAPHYLPQAVTTATGERRDGRGLETGERDFLGQTAVLEIEAFAALRHVSLRWEPADSLFRQVIEAQLELALAQTPSEGESEVGSWLTVLGLGLLALLFLGGMVLVLLRVVLP